MYHFEPKLPSELVNHEGESLFSVIGKQDLFVHHPFESFAVVEQFIAQAATDQMCSLLNKPCIA